MALHHPQQLVGLRLVPAGAHAGHLLDRHVPFDLPLDPDGSERDENSIPRALVLCGWNVSKCPASAEDRGVVSLQLATERQ